MHFIPFSDGDLQIGSACLPALPIIIHFKIII